MKISIVERLADLFSQIPGIGPKTAEKMAFSIIKKGKDFSASLISALSEVENLKRCSVCGIITDKDPCEICSDDKRDHSVICVVEESEDAFALEKTEDYNGVYHILGGSISPIKGVAPSDLRIRELVERVKEGGVKEVILATNLTTEGEATALFIAKELESFNVKITRIALGIPTGADIAYSDPMSLSKALRRRENFEVL